MRIRECSQSNYIVPLTHSHVHHINTMLSQYVTEISSPERFISCANFNASVRNGFSVIYSISWSSDASLRSYEYSTEDEPYSFFPLRENNSKKITDFFEDMACKITFPLTSFFSICSESSHSQIWGWWRQCCNPLCCLIRPTAPRPGPASLAHCRPNWVVSNNCGPQGVL